VVSAKVAPLSPYLFVIAINELSIHLPSELHNRNLTGISLGPTIHSLLFADDLILYGTALAAEAASIKTIFHEFSQLSSQVPNLQESSMLFNKNVDDNTKSQIRGIFPLPNLLSNTMQLTHLHQISP
jgi:hypothetical protein